MKFHIEIIALENMLINFSQIVVKDGHSWSRFLQVQYDLSVINLSQPHLLLPSYATYIVSMHGTSMAEWK